MKDNNLKPILRIYIGKYYFVIWKLSKYYQYIFGIKNGKTIYNSIKNKIKLWQK